MISSSKVVLSTSKNTISLIPLFKCIYCQSKNIGIIFFSDPSL